MKVDVINTLGKKIESISLPEDIFEVKVHDQVISQALRVYTDNQHQGSKSTLTRGEVNRTTAKVWKQKGTGRARHGSRRAPIFVGGGITFGPKPKTTKLSLNKKTKKMAILALLSQKALAKEIVVLDSIKGFDNKTKKAEKILKAIVSYTHSVKDKVLFMLPTPEKIILMSCKNLPGITLTQTKRLNVYEILNSKSIILTKETISSLVELFSDKSLKVKKENN